MADEALEEEEGLLVSELGGNEPLIWVPGVVFSRRRPWVTLYMVPQDATVSSYRLWQPT